MIKYGKRLLKTCQRYFSMGIKMSNAAGERSGKFPISDGGDK